MKALKESVMGKAGVAGRPHAGDDDLLQHPDLLERDEELRTGRNVLEAALSGEGGGVLVVEGAAGVGKTAFLTTLRERAAGSDVRILTATGGELEGGFPFGVVRQLFEPIARRRADALEGPARHAAAALGLVDEDRPAETTSQETLHGLYWLVAELTEERPGLLVVDDAHWADAPTIEFLEYLARRAEDLPLELVIATRPDEHGVDIDPIRRIVRLPQATVISLEELSPAAVTRLVREQLGPGAEDDFCKACHEATGGNPFLVLELLKELADEGVSPTAEQAPRVAQASPETVLRTVLVRLAALPEPAGLLAEALAVLGGEAQLRHAAALAELDPMAAAEGEEALIDSGILRPVNDAVAFVHPLVREVIYSDLSPGRRALREAQAAAILRDATVPAEKIVPHLFASEPTGEAWRVHVLREAARVARERGAAPAAVSALRRILVESSEASDDPAILDDLGSAELAVQDRGAIDHFERAIEQSDDPNHRGEMARKLVRVHMGATVDIPAAISALDRALAERDELRRGLALGLEADYLMIARVFPPRRDEALAKLAELRHADLPEDPSAAPLLATLARYALESTEPADAVAELAEQALTDPGPFFRDSGFLYSYAANALTWIDRVEAARAAWGAALAEGQQRASIPLTNLALTYRGHLNVRIGELADAEADLRPALSPLDGEHVVIVMYDAAAFMADVLIDRGDFREAEALLADLTLEGSEFVHSSRSRLHYARGRFEEARDAALKCCETFEWKGGGDAPAIVPWRSEAALAMAALGEHDEAVQLAAEELELARKQEVPRATGIALRTLGIIEDPEMDRLEEAVEVLEGSGSKIELARTLVDLGMALRRARRRADAREPLARGMDLAHRCGATVLEERAVEELLATGARPRRRAVTGLESLTPTELRVARLAAEDKSNREIAQALFVSMSTVATHLNHVYQKLHIAGRDQLADAL